MELSPIQCRAQEAFHRDRADNATLANVRMVSAKAAAAWAVAASAAESRQARRERTRIIAETLAVQNRSPDSAEEGLVSENPDRGLADAETTTPEHSLTAG